MYKKIITNNYASAIELSFLNNWSNSYIYLIEKEAKFIKHSFNKYREYRNSNMALLCEINKVVLDDKENLDNNIIIYKEDEDWSLTPELVFSYENLFNKLIDFSFICADDSDFIFNLFKSKNINANYIKVSEFKNSFEGIVWNKIAKLSNKPCSKIFFQDIVAFQDKYPEFYNEILPYIQYSKLKDHVFFNQVLRLFEEKAYEVLFKFITGFDPIWKIPFNKDGVFDKEFFNNCVLIEKYWHKENKHTILNKSSAPYFENVAFVGAKPLKGCKKHFVIDFNNTKHDKWEAQDIKLKINNFYEKKLALQGKISNLTASNLNFLDNEPNLYSYIKDCVISDLATSFKNNYHSIQEWENNLLKSGFEYIKIFNKAKELKTAFENWKNSFVFQEYAFKSFLEKSLHNEEKTKFYVDFYAKNNNKLYIATFLWNTPNATEFYKTDVKAFNIFKHFGDFIQEYVLISPSKIIKLEADKFENLDNLIKFEDQNIQIDQDHISLEEKNIKTDVKRKKTEKDDLFYWNLL